MTPGCDSALSDPGIIPYNYQKGYCLFCGVFCRVPPGRVSESRPKWIFQVMIMSEAFSHALVFNLAAKSAEGALLEQVKHKPARKLLT